MKKKPRLSLREIRILSMLADGCPYKEICEYFGISAANMHTTCAHIRKKNGIMETRDKDECTRHLGRMDKQRVADALSPTRSTTKDVTDCQIEVLRLIALGRSYTAIAALLGIRSQSVQNLATRACQYAGITHSGWNRTRYIKEWLQRNDPNLPASLTRLPPLPRDPMDDPMF